MTSHWSVGSAHRGGIFVVTSVLCPPVTQMGLSNVTISKNEIQYEYGDYSAIYKNKYQIGAQQTNSIVIAQMHMCT